MADGCVTLTEMRWLGMLFLWLGIAFITACAEEDDPPLDVDKWNSWDDFAVGVPAPMDVSVGCGYIRTCEPQPAYVLEASCRWGHCTTDIREGRLRIIPTKEGLDYVEVRARKPNGKVESGEAIIEIRPPVTKLTLQRLKGQLAAKHGVLPGTRFAWEPQLFSDVARVRFDESDLKIVTSDELANVKRLHDRPPYDLAWPTLYVVFDALRAGAAKITFRLAGITRVVPIEIVSPDDVTDIKLTHFAPFSTHVGDAEAIDYRAHATQEADLTLWRSGMPLTLGIALETKSGRIAYGGFAGLRRQLGAVYDLEECPLESPPPKVAELLAAADPLTKGCVVITGRTLGVSPLVVAIGRTAKSIDVEVK